MATDTLDVWTDGAPLTRLATTTDFATWSAGAPLLVFSTDEILSPPGIPSGEAVPSPSISADLVVSNPTISPTVPYPIWLVELATSPVTYAASVDLDTLAQPYAGWLVAEPTITKRITEVFWGLVEVQEISLSLANGTGRLTAAYLGDLRGVALVVSSYDKTTGALRTEWTGAVSQAHLDEGVLRLDGSNLDLSIFEREVPSVVVTTDVFPLAVDVGKTIPVVLGGAVPKVRALYVCENFPDNIYDYVVCQGFHGVGAAYRDGPNNTLYHILDAEYSVHYDLYNGDCTVLRFPVAQLDFQNARHQIIVDVTDGLSTPTDQVLNRNPVRIVRRILSTPSWGLGQPINAASFDAAEAVVATLNSLVCDGALVDPAQAQDLLRELLMVRGMRLGRNAALEWTISVDTQRSLVLSLGDGLGDGPRNVLECRDRHGPSMTDTVSRVVIPYRLDLLSNAFLFRQRRPVARALERGPETAQAVTASTITLNAAAGATVDQYTRMWVEIVSNGTPAATGQFREITAYATSRLASIGSWATTPTGTVTYRVWRTVGRDRLLPNRFLRDHTAADLVADYLGKRLTVGQDQATVIMGAAGRLLTEGDLVALSYARQGYTGDVLEVLSVEKALTTMTAVVQGWDAAIYRYDPGALPTDDTSGTGSDYSRTPPDAVTGLRLVSTGTEQTSDGTITAFLIVEFVTPVVNYVHALLSWRLSSAADWGPAGTVTGTGIVTAKLSGLLPNSAYEVTVQAQNAFGLVSVGDPVLSGVVTAVDPTPPPTPTACVAYNQPGAAVRIWLTFEIAADWAYTRLYRSDTADPDLANVIVDAKSSVFNDLDVIIGRRYYYWGRVFDTSGNASGLSPMATVLA